MAQATKTPQDHKRKASALDAPTSITITTHGRDWVIEAAALDDWELLEDLNDPSGASAPSAVRRFLGAEQYAAAKDIVRDESGRVPATAMAELIADLFAAVEQGNR